MESTKESNIYIFYSFVPFHKEINNDFSSLLFIFLTFLLIVFVEIFIKYQIELGVYLSFNGFGHIVIHLFKWMT